MLGKGEQTSLTTPNSNSDNEKKKASKKASTAFIKSASIKGVKEVVGHPEAEMASITNTENSASTEVNKNSGEKNASAS